jgi:citrate synthase
MSTAHTAGLEGVVAVETSIAEPDRNGGALRYRGVDIDDLVGRLRYEHVWGLLVDDDPSSRLVPVDVPTPTVTGEPMADLQAALAALAGDWGLGKLVDMDTAQVRADLERLSSAVFVIAAALAADRPTATDPTDDGAVAERFVRTWRGALLPEVVDAVETYWICTAEHGLNASTFTARIVASTGADAAACLAAAVGALSGPLHGGAPARVVPMLDEAEACGDADRAIAAILGRGERLMGFGHRVYRAEDPRARLLRETARRICAPRYEVALEVERAALAELARRKPDRVLATNVEYWSAVVLDAAGVPPHFAPVLFACSRTAGWSAHILEQHATGRLIRPAARYIGPPARQLSVPV